MDGVIFDLEGDGHTPNKIHCVSVNMGGQIHTTSDYDKMRKFFLSTKILVGHNIMRWDIPVIERLLGIEVKAKIVDTLALSWYLYPDRKRHGLEFWGEDFGVKKPEIGDWEGLTQEEYEHRCEEDVKINEILWRKQWLYLKRLYGSEEEAWRLIDYLTQKMSDAREQERSRWKLDEQKCREGLSKMEEEKEEKSALLAEVMPKVPVITKKTRPKKCFKQDRTPSAYGQAWFDLLEEKGLPKDYKGIVEVVSNYKDPNPNSIPQIKDWLYSLGWKPVTFKYDRNKETGDIRKIEQINKPFGEGICDSIKELYEAEPQLELLDGLFVISHRISILKGFLENVDDGGYIQARIQGFTNTLRFKHKVAVNLPGIDKPYGTLVRGCLVAPDGYELCGSDMSGLEDRTKQHYMWEYDPEFVKQQMADDFDPHTDLAVFSGALTKEQEQAYKDGDKSHKPIRVIYKSVNYACTYGAAGPTVARTAKVSTPRGYELVEAYWKRNWAIKEIADSCKVKTVNKQKWLFNPVSKLWYSLRYEKDRFSTLNQGTGVFVFDTWVANIRKRRKQLTAQFHDEVVLCIRKGVRDKCTKLLGDALEETNEQLGLNRRMDIDVQFGNSYAEIH